MNYVCTINEPNIAAMLAGGEDAANLVAYGLPNPDLARRRHAARRRTTAPREVAALGLRRCRPAGPSRRRPSSPPASRAPTRCCAEYGDPRDDWYLEQSAGDDFVGVQAYTRTFIGPEGPRPVADDVETTLTGWEFFPEAARDGRAQRVGAAAAACRCMVTENGIATADDTRRIAYTQGALEGLHACDLGRHRACAAYQHWSALDNYEWASGFRPTFGLIGFDHETFERTPKPSLAWLGEVATPQRPLTRVTPCGALDPGLRQRRTLMT